MQPAQTRLDMGKLGPASVAAYQCLQSDCGLVEVGACGWLSIAGPDAASFLQGLLTQDVHALAPGAAAPSWVLDANGKILFAVQVFRAARREFLLQVAGDEAGLQRHLDHYLVMEDAVLKSVRLACLSLQGAGTAERVLTWRERLSDLHWLDHDRCGLGGCDLAFDPDREDDVRAFLQTEGVPPLEPEALEVARIEMFLPLFGRDMRAAVNPLVYGLGRWVSGTKGCFIGQETIARTRDRGHPPRLAALLKAAGDSWSEAVGDLTHQGDDAGELTSAAWSPRQGAPLAIANIKFRLAEKGQKVNDRAGREWTIIDIGTYKA